MLLLALPNIPPQYSLPVIAFIANITPRPGFTVTVAAVISGAVYPMLAILVFFPPPKIAVQPFRLHEGFGELPAKFSR
jgi:hypothetical protein